MIKTFSKSGFTLIEILIVVVIVGIISSLFISTFTGTRDMKYLDSDTHLVLSIIDKARSQSLSSKNGLAYGVYFTSTGTTLFSGTSYSPSDVNNEVVVTNTPVRISGINLAGGGSSILFSKLTGETAQNGSITLSLVSSSTISRIITIHKTGVSELNTQ